MYLKKFNMVSLSKHRVLFSTICLSLSVSFLATQSISSHASNLTEHEELADHTKQSAVAKWVPIVVEPEKLQSVDFEPGLKAYGETAKFLKTFVDSDYAAQIASRESKRRSATSTLVDEKTALALYQGERVAEAWKYWIKLRDLLNVTNARYPIMLGAIAQLISQNNEMRQHIQAEEKRARVVPSQVSVSLNDEDLARLKQQAGQAAEAKDIQERRIQELEAKVAAQKLAAQEKEASEIRAIEEKNRRIAQLERQLAEQPAHNNYSDAQALRWKAEADFYSDRVSWWYCFWDWVLNRKPNAETVPLRISDEV